MKDEFACLAVETATDLCTVAAVKASEVSSVELPDPRASVRDIYRSLNRVISEAGLKLAELDCIAFGAGQSGPSRHQNPVHNRKRDRSVPSV